MKIAFLVENHYWEKHFGVKNLFKTIEAVLSEDNTVEEIVYLNVNGNSEWFKVDLDYFGEDQSYSLLWEKGQKKWTKEQIDYLIKEHKRDEIKPRIYYRPIGNTLRHEEYDIVIITNPWLVQPEMEIDSKEIIGLVHDFIANRYAISKRTSFLWADLHRIGYDYYNKNCTKILCNSETTLHEYELFYPQIEKKRIRAMKPFVTYQYNSYDYNSELLRENAIVLAAPFDPRKGIDIIPRLINGVKEQIDKLYIFGKIRCKKKDADLFFDSLDVDLIQYYPYIAYRDLADLYNKAKILLFPSREEGLGIPLIEAQYFGCRVLTTNKEPMCSLIMTGSNLMFEDDEKDIKLLSRMLEEEFDHMKLSKASRSRFCYNDLLKCFEVK